MHRQAASGRNHLSRTAMARQTTGKPCARASSTTMPSASLAGKQKRHRLVPSAPSPLHASKCATKSLSPKRPDLCQPLEGMFRDPSPTILRRATVRFERNSAKARMVRSKPLCGIRLTHAQHFETAVRTAFAPPLSHQLLFDANRGMTDIFVSCQNRNRKSPTDVIVDADSLTWHGSRSARIAGRLCAEML